MSYYFLWIFSREILLVHTTDFEIALQTLEALQYVASSRRVAPFGEAAAGFVDVVERHRAARHTHTRYYILATILIANETFLHPIIFIPFCNSETPVQFIVVFGEALGSLELSRMSDRIVS